MPDSVEKRERLTSQQEYDKLEELYRDRLPKNWDEMSRAQRLDWFGHRMLLDWREEEKKNGNKDFDFLSDYQLERRRRREIHSKLDGWDEIPPGQKNFHRVHIDKNNLVVGKDERRDDGQKNP